MISSDHPRFSCTSDMSLTIYGKNFSGPLVHTNDPSGTGVCNDKGNVNKHMKGYRNENGRRSIFDVVQNLK